MGKKAFLLIFILLAFVAWPAKAQVADLGLFTPADFNQKFSSDLSLRVNGTDYKVPAPDVQKWLTAEEDIFWNPNYLSEIENTNLCRYKKSIACALSFDVKMGMHSHKISRISLDKNAVAKFLEDFARQVDKDPTDAKLQFEGGKVSFFSLSSNGLKLDQDKSLEKISSYLTSDSRNGSIELAYSETRPDISIDSIDNLGIIELIGEGRSNFKGSPKNRIFNIKVATNRFDGTLIKPGEEFSFVKILGEVDGEHGYLPELVIKKDKTEPEFGGGICQVSTTAFRAAIYSGLKITARKNHAYPVQYYNPQGMDATVYVPRPDLRFTNNTPGHILIQTEISGTELIFRFYGTSDGRKTEVDGPKILERNPDGSLKTTFSQKVYYPNGNLMIDDVFNSSYDSPSKYPHPGETFTTKPDGWSKKQWSDYKKAHDL